MELLPVTKDAFIGPYHVMNLTQIYAVVGEYESAIDQLEYLLSIPSYASVQTLRWNPAWDVLRDHPRFQQLLEQYSEHGS